MNAMLGELHIITQFFIEVLTSSTYNYFLNFISHPGSQCLSSTSFFSSFTLYPAINRIGRESVKTFRSSLSAEFWRHGVLSGGTRYQSEKMKISNILFRKNRTHNLSRLQSHACFSEPRHGTMFLLLLLYIF